MALFAAVAALGALWQSGGLASLAPGPPAVDVAELRPVSLPDLSPLEPEVRAQLQQAHDDLTRLAAAPAPDRSALAAAQGKLGMLLLAYDEAGAEAPLANAEALAPEDSRWPYFLGRLHRLAGDFERAAGDFERALVLMPDYAPAKLRLGQMYRELGRDDEAEEVLTAALAANPKAVGAHEILGQIAFDRGDFEAAIGHYEAVLAEQPGASAIHSPLAMAYERAGQKDKSEEHLAQLGTVRPAIDDPMDQALMQLMVGSNVLLMQADRALEENRPADAIALYHQVVAADPENARANLNLGIALNQQGNHAEALSWMRKAVAADPSNAEFQQTLADQLGYAGLVDEAETTYREALALDPMNGQAHHGLAETLRVRGRCEEALPNYSSAIEILTTDTVLRVQQAFCLVTLGRYGEAITALEDAHGDFPDDPEVLDALARVLAAAPEEALRDGRRASELAEALYQHRKDLAAQETAAMALAAAGSFGTASEVQQRAIEQAKQEGQTAWLDFLRANLDRYRKHEPASAPWPPFVIAPAQAGP